MLLKDKLCTKGALARCTYPILLLVALMSLAFSSTLLAQTATPKHGISIVKGCVGVTAVGSPMLCNYTIRNNTDEGDGTLPLVRHTLTFNYIEDIVCTGGTGGLPGGCIGKAADLGLPTFSGNIIGNLTFSFSNEEGGAMPSCDNGATGNSMCTLPPGGRIDSDFYAFYTVEADDFDPLPDVVVLNWVDLCVPEPADNNCPQQEQQQTTGSSTNLTCETSCGDSQCNACNESTNLCETKNEGLVCDPTDAGSLCVPDSCVAGECTADTGERRDCGDGGQCYADYCEDTDGECYTRDTNEGLVCDPDDPGSLCVPDSCLAGECTADTGERRDCGAGGQCYDDYCEDTDGECYTRDTNEGLVCDPDDPGSLCVPDSCLAGECTADTGERRECGDGGQCYDDYCEDTDGECYTRDTNEGLVCDPDDPGSLCVPDSCLAGECTADTGERDNCEGDECQVCNDSTGVCNVIPRDAEPAAPDACFGNEICRTPGFWGSRGGFDGDGYWRKGQDVVGEVIGDDGLLVCGTLILRDADIGTGQNATEAICVKGGDPRAKMMRMLMSASLNCALGDCSTNTSDLVSACNEVCETEDSGSYGACQSALGCFNEGGHINSDGTCVAAGQAVCEDSGESCSGDGDCNVLTSEACVSYESCHDRMACPDYYDDGEVNGSADCYEPLGAASSPKKCNAARQTTPYIFNLPGWGETTP